MALFGSLAKENHFSEFGDSLDTQAGVLTAAQRQALALANLGLAATAAEVNLLHSVTAGTVAASKALVVDTNKDLGTLRNVTLSGTLTRSGVTATNIDALTDNLADALSFKEGANFYLTFVTTDGAEAINLQKATNLTAALTTTDGVASGTARAVGGMAKVGISTTDTVTGVTSNNAFVSFATNYVIPANTLKAGTLMRIKAVVSVNDASNADTLTCQLLLGATSLIASTAVDPTSTSDHHVLSFDVIARAAPGAAAAVVGQGTWTTNTGGTSASKTAILASTNLATNGALTLAVQAKWSANGASESARLEIFSVEVIG